DVLARTFVAKRGKPLHQGDVASEHAHLGCERRPVGFDEGPGQRPSDRVVEEGSKVEGCVLCPDFRRQRSLQRTFENSRVPEVGGGVKVQRSSAVSARATALLRTAGSRNSEVASRYSDRSPGDPARAAAASKLSYSAVSPSSAAIETILVATARSS